MTGEYVLNKETMKIEMTLDKEEYKALDADTKKNITSNFLFSRKNGGTWVSRTKFPNTYRAEAVAKSLGLTDGGKVGEMLSFEDQMKRKAERAEARAERYDGKSDAAAARGEALQKPIDNMHGDIAFFTQPNINSSSGRAFTKKRNRMFDAWFKGADEFRKSEYYAERARVARETANGTKPTDKGFIDRRMKEADKSIRAQKKNLEDYQLMLEKIESGQEIKRYSGEILEKDEILGWIEHSEMILENEISKWIYYNECMEDLGGVQFSKDNIKVGYIVEIEKWGKCRVVGTGKVNITFEIMDRGAGFPLTAAYAEIKRVISTDVSDLPKHPFKVGETFIVDAWSDDSCAYEKKEYKITKVTDEKVTLKCGGERAINRKPRRIKSFDGSGGYQWALGIADGRTGTVYKKEEDA